jgi:hypothetical protein
MGSPLTYRNEPKARAAAQLESVPRLRAFESPGLVPEEISGQSVLTETKQRIAEEAKPRMAGSCFPRWLNRTKRVQILKSCGVADAQPGRAGMVLQTKSGEF